MRKGLIFLMILALTAVSLPVSAETADFPFLPGLGWNSSVEDLESIIGVQAEGSDQTIGNSGQMFYFSLKDSGLAPVPYELAMTMSSGNVISMMIFMYNVGSASDKEAVRGQITDEMEKLYGERGMIMFDTPDSMIQAFADKADLQDTVLGTALGGMEGALKNMYGDLNLIVRTKGWLVDRKYAAVVAYSTKGPMADMAFVIMLNIDETISMMADGSLPENRTGCFDLPAGAYWMCSTAELKAALDNAGISYTADGETLQVSVMSGPGGSIMSGIYMFQDGGLMGTAYIVFGTDFDALERLMIQEYGNMADINTEQIKTQIRSLMGISATRASVWVGSESLYYLFESTQGCFIVQVSTQAVMAQQ